MQVLTRRVWSGSLALEHALLPTASCALRGILIRTSLLLVSPMFCLGTVYAQAVPCPTESSISIPHGWFEVNPGVRYQLTNFRAKLIPNGKVAPQCYGRATVVSKAQIFVTSESLTTVFAQKLQASDSKIKDFAVHNDVDGATLTGTIKKVIPLHFSIQGPVTTDGNLIRLTAKSVKADGIPVKELLKLIGAELNTLLPLRNLKGIQVEEDSLSFSPEAVADLKGHISSVTTSTQGLTLRYDTATRKR